MNYTHVDHKPKMQGLDSNPCKLRHLSLYKIWITNSNLTMLLPMN